ncbi:uracil-DNA glycosylase [Streptomyces sp. 8L]|uniref:uracil-DNA glycosylase n=1 Tax=Streptomyces sp. 8L TaxID=2877242 RepID=UPI001CD23D21|nr:uracil-DNA glycosylase [Streptomyces sp. 8L]MCA1223826.1 uracil-DNA glycosylase [Streptomyces sp. 8L]
MRAEDDPAFPVAAARSATTVTELDESLTHCAACPRLVAWRRQKAHDDLPAYRGQKYWARPVPGFGPADAPLMITGLAPAAHGGNRTGRMFTGDRSGDVLFAALYDLGLASRPDPVSADDGMTLRGVRMSSPVRCAPPQNRPTPAERDTCRPWLARELELLAPTLRAIVVLGGFGWQALMPPLAAAGWAVPRPRPVFGHGARIALRGPAGERPLDVFGCYHVSQRNVFTGLLTPRMLREVLATAAGVAGLLP